MKVGNYPDGYNLSLLNTIYHYPFKDNNNKWNPDAIDLIVKDNNTGEKFLETIESPPYEFFMVLDKYYIQEYDKHGSGFYPHFVDKEKCKSVVVPYMELKPTIADILGVKDKYYDNIKIGNRRANDQLCNTHPKILMSDMDIEDNIRFQFSNTYQNAFGSITKSYLDIEADTINCKGDFVQPGECPINAVSFIDDNTMTIHSFLLRNDKNPLITEFESIANSESNKKDLFDFLEYAVGGHDNFYKYKLDSMSVQFHFYDECDEIKLIAHLFNYINNLKPDFVLAWNMAFDIPYIIQRIINLGYNPKDIMCSNDFKYKEVKYYIDERNKNNFEERNDYCKISSYSVYTDQLIQFASRRKGRSAFANYKLDYIGGITCGVRKLDYSHITKNLSELPYKDYKTFVFYNIVDTLVQYCIEFKVNDIGCVYNDVLLNNTKYAKIHRQTIYLKNRAAKSYYKEGFILGNNVNGNNPKVKFPGAFVSDPALNSDYSKMTINGKPVMIFDNLDDFDYKSLYPSITSEFNMAPHTIIAHVNIPEQVYPFENRFKRDEIKWRREAQFMDDLQSHNWIEFFSRWFGFANYEEMYDDVIEFFNTVYQSKGFIQLHEFDKVYENCMKKGSPFLNLRNDRDRELYELHKLNKIIEQPKFDFDNSDFNNFTDIFNSVKDGYKYSRPKNYIGG